MAETPCINCEQTGPGVGKHDCAACGRASTVDPSMGGFTLDGAGPGFSSVFDDPTTTNPEDK